MPPASGPNEERCIRTRSSSPPGAPSSAAGVRRGKVRGAGPGLLVRRGGAGSTAGRPGLGRVRRSWWQDRSSRLPDRAGGTLGRRGCIAGAPRARSSQRRAARRSDGAARAGRSPACRPRRVRPRPGGRAVLGDRLLRAGGPSSCGGPARTSSRASPGCRLGSRPPPRGCCVPDGRLVYSVCTFPRAETDAACDAILRRVPELEPIEIAGPEGPAERVRLWPHAHGCDAMFVAAFRRRATPPG